jgi:hypothetical protein
MRKRPKAKPSKAKELQQEKSLIETDGYEIVKRHAIDQFEGAFDLIAKEALGLERSRCCKSCAKTLPKVRKLICFDCFPQFLIKDDQNLFC